nr:retrovirus-related Pol polyprotein from transposon TNT 1-94 [Tanacetum cinerariifolium]
MHNNIMAPGSRDRPPMLAQDDILNGVHVQDVEATDNSPAVPEYTTVETPTNMSPENKAHFLAEKEAIHLILTGIGDDIYSTVDAFQTAQETWEAIERLQQVNELRAEKLARNANPLELVATAQASQDLFYQSSRSHRSQAPSSKPLIPTKSQTATRHKGKEIAKPITPPSETASEGDSDPEQAQRDKDMQKNLSLIAKYFKKIYKPTNNNLKTSLTSKNKNVDTTPRFKIDSQSGKFGNQRMVNVVAAREKVGIQVVHQFGIQCFNCKEYGHLAKECKKPKRVKDSAYHKEKMLLCKQAEQGVLVQAEQYDWLADTDEEVDEQELEAHYIYIAKIQEVPTADSGIDSEPVEQVQNNAKYNVFSNDLQHSEQSKSVCNTCLVQTNNRNVIPDSPDMCKDDIQNDQNDVESNDERVMLANLIANLKLDVDENKKIQKQLKKANTTLAQELNECKTVRAKTSKSLGESISVRDSFLVVLQTRQTEFKKYKAFNDHTVDYDKLKHKLNEALGQLAQKDTVIREGLKTKAFELSMVKEKHDELMKLSLLTKSHYEGQKNDTVCNEKASNVFRKEREQYFEIQDLKAQMQDKDIVISELKKLIEKSKGKYVDTKFDRPSVVRQPNVQRIPKPSVLGKPTPFLDSLERKYFPKTKSVPKTNVSEGLLKLVTTHTLPQTAKKAVSNTNVLRPGMYRIDNRIAHTRAPLLPQTVKNTNLRVSTSTGVNHKPNVSRPQLKSNQSRDKVLPNNSQVKVKKTQVEVYPRIPSVSNQIKSVTACKDNLNSRTSNANAIVQLILFIVDSGCTKHMTGNLKLLCNFIDKFVGNRGSNLYTISLQESTSSTPLCLMAKATPTQAWLWHQRLSHLNFDYINLLSKKDIVIGLPKLTYVKDQLCSSCELSKAKRSSFKSKVVPSSKRRLILLHMDLCGPMRVASINRKKYILVIVDDYSRYTWTLFLHSKDETLEVLKDFLMMIQRNLQASVIIVRTDRGTEFLNKTLNAFFKEEGIEHQTSIARTPK